MEHRVSIVIGTRHKMQNTYLKYEYIDNREDMKGEKFWVSEFSNPVASRFAEQIYFVHFVKKRQL